MSGAPWGYENWEEGEPNQNGNEDCTAFDSQAEYKVNHEGARKSEVWYLPSTHYRPRMYTWSLAPKALKISVNVFPVIILEINKNDHFAVGSQN